MPSISLLFNWMQWKIRSVKTKYYTLSPKGTWEILRKFINMWLTVTGLPIADRKFKLYWLSYLPAFLGLDFTVLMIYTICKFISEPLKALQSTCGCGVVYPVIEIYFSN